MHMINATATMPDGRTLLILGLSFGNLNKFLTEPGDTFIKVNGTLMDLPIDVLLFSGRNEAHLMELMKDTIGPNTKVHIDPKVKDSL
jgi:predicted alpha/beta-fold hydrolase